MIFLLQRTLKYLCRKSYLAYQALSRGMASTIILNAANEIAVEAFLKKIIPFVEIPVLIDLVLQSWSPKNPENIDDILAIDAQARVKAESLMSERAT